MKTIYLSILSLCLIALSCEKRQPKDEPIVPCHSESETPVSEINEFSTIMLSSYPDELVLQPVLVVNEQEAVLITRPNAVFRNICVICNLPNYVKQWNIPEKGLLVTFSGKLYEDHNEYPAVDSHYVLELTNIQKNTESVLPLKEKLLGNWMQFFTYPPDLPIAQYLFALNDTIYHNYISYDEISIAKSHYQVIDEEHIDVYRDWAWIFDYQRLAHSRVNFITDNEIIIEKFLILDTAENVLFYDIKLNKID